MLSKRSLLPLLLILLACLALAADANFLWPNQPKRHQSPEKSLDEIHPSLIPNHLFDLIRGAPSFGTQRFSTLTKTDEGWVFQLDVPGLSLDEISVHAEGQVMVIRGDHKCGKQAEQTCVERHVYEEIRLSESADLDTAEADLDLGVLKVHIRPKSGGSSRSRAVKIIDRARNKASSWGETLKHTFTWQHDANVDSVKQSAAEYGSEVEQAANGYIKQIQHKLQIPLEKQQEFADRVHAKSQDVYRQLKEKSLTPNEAYNRLYDNAEEILGQIRNAADKAWDRARDMKGIVARDAWETAGNLKDDVKRKTEHASQFAKRQAEHAGDAASQAAELAKSAAKDVKDTVERKAGEAYDSAVNMKDSAEQKVFEAAAEGKEKAEAFGKEAGEKAEQAKQALEDAARQASEKAGQVADKAGDVKDKVVEKMGDVKEDVKAKMGDLKEDVKTKLGDAIDHAAPKVDEAAHDAKRAADEAAQRASINAQEAAHSANVAAREATYNSEKKAENMADSLKRKLGL